METEREPMMLVLEKEIVLAVSREMCWVDLMAVCESKLMKFK